MLLAGVAALPLAACEPVGDGSGDVQIVPEVVQFFAVLGAFAMIAGPIGSVFGIPALVTLSRWIEPLATTIEWLDRLTPVYNALRRSPATDVVVQTAQSKVETGPVAIVSTDTDNLVEDHFANICFVTGSVTVALQVENRTDTDFAVHNVYWVCRPIDMGAPTVVEDVTSAPASDAFSVALARSSPEVFQINLGLAPNRGYVLYSWIVRVGDEFTNEVVRDQMMIGPIIHCCDPNDAVGLDAVAQAANQVAPPRFEYRAPMLVQPLSNS